VNWIRRAQAVRRGGDHHGEVVAQLALPSVQQAAQPHAQQVQLPPMILTPLSGKELEGNTSALRAFNLFVLRKEDSGGGCWISFRASRIILCLQ
jgi:hypothetical protein